MTVNVTRDAINVREKLAELDKPTGIAGEAMLRADTVVDQAELLGYRQQNVLINGDMSVDQRGDIASGISNNEFTSCDRWKVSLGGVVRFGSSKSSEAPDGFAHSLKLDVSTADTSIAASDFADLRQQIEGYHLVPFASGTSKAKHHTLSFWVRSSVTGTYITELRYGAGSLEFSKAYTINQADTWEYKVLVFPPQTTNEPTYDNTLGLSLRFWLMSGSTYAGGSALSTTWSTTDNVRAVGQVNAVDSTDNDFYITGVQLLAGNYPDGLPFMHRSYGEELALCQRYYYRLTTDGGADRIVSFAAGVGSNDGRGTIQFPVTMRTNPTALEQSGTASHYRVYSGGTTNDCTSVPTFNARTSANAAHFTFTSTGNFTLDQIATLLFDNTASAYLGWSAEL